MTLLLWILAYLAVGFGVGMWVTLNVHRAPLWPWTTWRSLPWLTAFVFVAPLTPLQPLIRWCARRLP